VRQLPLGVQLQIGNSPAFCPGRIRPCSSNCSGQIACGPKRGHRIYGPPGAGKTHLLQAVCAQRAQSAIAAYLPLRELKAMGPESLSGWQHAQCLCIDDVDAVLGRVEWERALFGIYREAEEHGAALVISAAAPPRALTFALPDLGSRYASGVIYAVLPLDEAEQREALRLRARLRGLDLPDETARFLQRRMPRDMETLYGLLDTLDAAALQAQRRLTVPFIRECWRSGDDGWRGDALTRPRQRRLARRRWSRYRRH
jgi:DnaA family protein